MLKLKIFRYSWPVFCKTRINPIFENFTEVLEKLRFGLWPMQYLGRIIFCISDLILLFQKACMLVHIYGCNLYCDLNFSFRRMIITIRYKNFKFNIWVHNIISKKSQLFVRRSSHKQLSVPFLTLKWAWLIAYPDTERNEL